MSRQFIPYSCQCIEEDDIEAVVRALRSEWVTQGPAIPAFERRVAEYCGAPEAVAVSSATAGLHLACLALGIGPGDTVWTSPLSFVASANCARYVGATVDFVDIDPATGNLCPRALEKKLIHAQKEGRLPKAVIPVHFAGRACDMSALGALKARYGFRLIEDAAHALGARYADGTPVGNSAVSDAAVFSFHAVKPITTGEGGMVMTQDPELAGKLRILRTHGITREPALLERPDMPAWYYEQHELGYHYRMTDIQAALGTSQMGKLDRFIAHRQSLAERYHAMLHDLPTLTLPPSDNHCGWHLYAVQVSAVKRQPLFEALRARGIGANVHYIPIHLQPYYQKLGFTSGDFPQAEAFFARVLSLPLHPRMEEGDQDRVVEALRALA